MYVKPNATLSKIMLKAHAEARANGRPRMSYRERFRAALRRAWRDARLEADRQRLDPAPPADPQVEAELDAFVIALFAKRGLAFTAADFAPPRPG